MCGIAGMFANVGAEEGLARTGRMIHALRHRGPDAEATTCIRASDTRNLFLGHARLSILDLTEFAAQPMSDARTGSQLIFNGEIYNFRELRTELEALGHSIRSSGDTEVVLKALIQWGPSAMRRFRGMYALAFWDAVRARVLLARDPFGIKPLLLARAGDSVLFASELRGLAASGLARFSYSPTAIQSYLAFGFVVEPATIVNEVVSVPPGHVIEIDSDGRILPPRRIIGIEEQVVARNRVNVPSFADAVTRTGELLQRSVNGHLISDVPVGIFLSGGIDSSLIAVLANRSDVAADLRYLTVCFPEQQFSELGYAEQVARTLSGHHTAVSIDASALLELLPRALSCMDQPTVDGINTFIISRVAADQGIKVVISGLGGDEIFGGYTTFWKAPLLGRHAGLLSRLARLTPAWLFGSQIERLKLIRARDCFDVRDAYLLQRSVRWGKDSAGGTLNSALVTPETWNLMTACPDDSDFTLVAYMESMFYMRNQLLHDGDIMSSANSVELRVPFLDLDLLEFAWALPESYHRTLMSGGKRLTKQVLSSLRPDLQVSRQKMGFVFPWRRWLREPAVSEMITDVIHSNSLYQDITLSPDAGKGLLAAFKGGDSATDWSQVWSLFVLLDWSGRFRSHSAPA